MFPTPLAVHICRAINKDDFCLMDSASAIPLGFVGPPCPSSVSRKPDEIWGRTETKHAYCVLRRIDIGLTGFTSLTVPEMQNTVSCGRGYNLGFVQLRLPGAKGPGRYFVTRFQRLKAAYYWDASQPKLPLRLTMSSSLSLCTATLMPIPEHG